MYVNYTGLIVTIVVIIVVVYGFAIGTLCEKLAVRKNYPASHFWLGALFGIIGLLYVGFLPMDSEKADITEDADSTVVPIYPVSERQRTIAPQSQPSQSRSSAPNNREGRRRTNQYHERDYFPDE